jgi:hypothetical protein
MSDGRPFLTVSGRFGAAGVPDRARPKRAIPDRSQRTGVEGCHGGGDSGRAQARGVARAGAAFVCYPASVTVLGRVLCREPYIYVVVIAN